MGSDTDERRGMEEEARRKTEENTLAVRTGIWPCAGILEFWVGKGKFFIGMDARMLDAVEGGAIKGWWWVILHLSRRMAGFGGSGCLMLLPTNTSTAVLLVLYYWRKA